MTFYHVRITPTSNPSHDEVRVDLSREELMERFVVPYRKGNTLVISGTSIPSNEIQRIRISRSEQDSKRLGDAIRAEQRASSVISFGGPSIEWRVANRAEDVTDEFITAPPGSESGYFAESDSEANTLAEIRPAADAREVFVVHGRNIAAQNAMFDFLTVLGLHPLEWSEVIQLTGKTMPYIGEILDTAFSNAHAVIILMTPDDEARLIDALQSEIDLPFEKALTGQARPNVLFEAGMAMGRHPERTIIVELGELRPFSDVSGLHVIRLNDSSQRRQELAQRLKTAGCPVNLEGTRWHTAGDFESALAATQSDDPESANYADHRASTAKELDLSDDAKELLTEITRDASGEIVKFTSAVGFFFRTNGRAFGNMGNPREEARWDGTVRDLLKLGFLAEDPGSRGKLFKVTREGFDAIDDLGGPR